MSYKYGIDKRQLENSPIGDENSSFPSPTPTAVESDVLQTPTIVTTERPTATITETTSSVITTTVIDNADASNTSSSGSSNNVLVAALLGTIGLIIILSGLLIIILWLRRGEHIKGVIGNRGLTDANDNGSLDADSTNDEIVTYRPSDPDDDEQLPSYAEAVVRGRNKRDGYL